MKTVVKMMFLSVTSVFSNLGGGETQPAKTTASEIIQDSHLHCAMMIMRKKADSCNKMELDVAK